MAYTSYWPPRIPGFSVSRWGPGSQHKVAQKEKQEDFEPFIPPSVEEILDDDEDRSPVDEEPMKAAPSQTFQVRPKERMLTLRPYRFRQSKNSWKHIEPSGMRDELREKSFGGDNTRHISQIRIITWNVDMASKYPEERLSEALRHIEEDVLQCKEDQEPEPCCILLQEVKDSMLPFLLKDSWVRRWFVVAPFTKDKWPEGAWYGNVTLVSRSIEIAECHILHYGFSAQQRTALCVKIKLNPKGSQEKVVLSIVNTHLESLPTGAPLRPKQLELASRFLRLQSVVGGIIAGDMNAISPEDVTIASDLGLRDSWRRGDLDTGNTWGYQGQNAGNYPPNRLDKIYYLPDAGYKVEEPKRIGMGIKVREDEDDAVWVSDHYGLETTLRMNKGKSNSTSSE